MTFFSSKLAKGYLSFKQNLDYETSRHYKELAVEGQKPDIMVIACCDSRVSPEIIFNTSPGEIFVVRNISNLIPPFQPDGMYHATSSAVEYGVINLHISNILILGHEDCGGIAQALKPQEDNQNNSDFMGRWLSLLEPLSKPLRNNTNLSPMEKNIILEQFSLVQSINNLRSFPWIKEREQAGKLKLSAAWFSIEKGDLWILNENSGQFQKLIA